MSPRYVLACDIGGTFTDIVVRGNGAVRTLKVSSTPDDYSSAILGAVRELRESFGIEPRSIEAVVHATTVATNTILEHKGAKTALVTTEGFRDVLEMRRLRIPVMYDLQYDKPPPLVPRRLRFEVAERLGPRGEVKKPLDEAQVAALADRLLAEGVESVAVCLLHSYADAAHERRTGEILRRRLDGSAYVTLSSDILPEIREYERTSTAVVNAYIGPIVRRYVSALSSRLKAAGVDGPLHIMQSNGGTMSAAAAADKPAFLVESGPAAGVIACADIARSAGLGNVISFDMGGTTAKAAIVEDGEPARTTEYEVGAGINVSSKLVKGGGYAIKLPFIDISEIGAGGGSIVSVDLAGAIRVGPQSAGAVPGPACYGLGGTEATFTDAAVVLGYLNPQYLVGGKLKIDAARSREAIERKVAKPMNLGLLEAAYGVYSIAVATMTRAVKAVSTYRGRDPRDFGLVAFGGNGPVVAVAIARELEMRRVLIPPAPGVFSAAGLLFSNVEHTRQQSVLRPTRELDARALASAFAALEAGALQGMAEEGIARSRITLKRFADLRYTGQAFELTVPADDAGPAALEAAFHAEHERTYGHSSQGDPVDLINLRVVACAAPQGKEGFAERLKQAQAPAAGKGARQAFFAGKLLDTPVLSRAGLKKKTRGPLIVEEFDATCVVPPGAAAALDAHGNILIDAGEP
ncbi:MAG TPA: hydantoinase/oxoprolinase family protein [Burkholderiales bacterium]|nr:hydantoinase/oxoprolinase family protein [Burkholderiales bacterium]